MTQDTTKTTQPTIQERWTQDEKDGHTYKTVEDSK